MKKRFSRALIASLVMSSFIVTSVNATPNADELKKKKEETQSEVDSLQSQLTALATKMNELEIQLIEKGEQITQAESDLKTAQEKEQQQYEDLKLRIKYMYEEGDGSALERIMSSGSIAEVLKQAEYVQKVHTYDRKQLEVYQETVQEVADLKETLESDQKKLQSLENEYQAQSDELTSTIESKSAEIENLDSMIQEAARIAAEKAAKEAEEAAAAQAAANHNTSNNNTNNNTNNNNNNSYDNGGSNSGGSPSSGGGSSYVPPADDGTIVGRAYSWVGKAEYVWGGCAPGAFDCSGFVSYCLTGQYSRLGTTWTFLGWPRVSNPQPGDVCVNAGHCGIYIGGGQMIHAADYGIGVIIGPVQSGMVYVRY